MQLSGIELAAILKSGISMVAADGVVKDEEKVMLVQNLAKFNVPVEDAKAMMASALSMDTATMFLSLSNLGKEEQKYVCGYWAAIAAIDGEIHDKEISMWQLLCTLSGFPTMTFGEALEFWGER